MGMNSSAEVLQPDARSTRTCAQPDDVPSVLLDVEN